jgi:hypothetical protein
MKTQQIIFFPLCLLCLATVASAQQATKEDTMRDCPMHQEHATADSHHAGVEKHGDAAMGFSHEKTTHHFLLSANGGSIEVTANEATDKPSTDAIRAHLSHITVMFGNGDFQTPMFIHDGIPPGVTSMKLLKSKIQYKYEEISSGGRVRIESSDPVAIAAIHDFLRFQISEHRTGDPLTAADRQ